MPFRHIVLLTFRDGTDVEGIVDVLRTLPSRIPELRSYVVGVDAGLGAGNATVGVVADFDDADGYATYRDHPEHQRVIEELVKPHLTARAAVQHAT